MVPRSGIYDEAAIVHANQPLDPHLAAAPVHFHLRDSRHNGSTAQSQSYAAA